jgi:hypothetical protein
MDVHHDSIVDVKSDIDHKVVDRPTDVIDAINV